jgi:hypothetical protein
MPKKIEKIYCNVFIVCLIVLLILMYIKKKKHVIKYKPYISVRSNSGDMNVETEIFEMFANKLAKDIDTIEPDKNKYASIKKYLENAILSTRKFIDENLKENEKSNKNKDNIDTEKLVLNKKINKFFDRDDITEETDDIEYKLLELSDNMSKISLILNGNSQKGMLDITDLENMINTIHSKKNKVTSQNENNNNKQPQNENKYIPKQIRKCASEMDHGLYDGEYTNLIKDMGKFNYIAPRDKDVLSQYNNNSLDYINRNGKKLECSNYGKSLYWSMSDRIDTKEKCGL